MSDFPTFDRGSDHLNLIQATSEIGIWELDAETGKAERNLRHDQIFGHETLLDEWSAEIFLSYVAEEDRDRVENLLNSSLTDGNPWSFETRIRRADGVDRWISAKGMPIFSDSGEVTKLIGHVIDITETKRNEDRLKLLSRELDHRVSNTFAIMNSMIRQVAKRADSVEEFSETLMERLAALSRANKVLISDEAERSSLKDILTTELDAFSGWLDRISITGETRIWFTGEASEALAMIFHELLTNAVKHGALSLPDGNVSIDVSTHADRTVSIRWVETGGPAIADNRLSGIGSSIFRNALRDDGAVDISYSDDGLKCDIRVHRSFQNEALQKTPPVAGSAAAQAADPETWFSGRRIMVVEDDPIIGMDLADIFESRGATVLGPFSRVTDALAALESPPEAALIDFNLGRTTSDEIASRLSELAVPFIVLTGQLDSADLGEAFEGVTVISKPFREVDLVAQMIALGS